MVLPSDVGITLNKSLAWTILVAVIFGGIWVGIREQTLAVANKQISDQEQRIRVLEGTASRLDSRLIDITDGLDDIQTILRDHQARQEGRTQFPGP